MVNYTTQTKTIEHSAYDEPDPEDDVWPNSWTKKQRSNWRTYAQDVYEALETEAGRRWYRRTWRPKARNEGMLKRDHVKLGTPEDYVAENVSDRLNPMGDMTSVMMRQLGTYDVDTDELDEAVEDIVQAKISQMSVEQKAELSSEAQRLARTYGLDLEG